MVCFVLRVTGWTCAGSHDGRYAGQERGLRFGAELVFAICEAKQVEVVILNQGEDTRFEEDLAKDVLEIITVFSARLYGSRSRKNQKLLENVKAAVESSSC
jgi:predicted site-specific integrase-resolvase